MTQSPRAVAREALRVAQEALPPYSAPLSRNDFTTHQLFAVHAHKTVLQIGYRGAVAFLADCAPVTDLGLTKLPHYTPSSTPTTGC